MSIRNVDPGNPGGSNKHFSLFKILDYTYSFSGESPCIFPFKYFGVIYEYDKCIWDFQLTQVTSLKSSKSTL